MLKYKLMNTIQKFVSFFFFKKNCISRNIGLVSSGDILTSWGEGASLALVGHPSSDDIMIKIPYGVDVLLH